MSDVRILTARQIARFKKHRLGYWSFWLVIGAIIFASLSDFIANSKPLVFRYQGKMYFPILSTVTNRDLNIKSAFLEVNYHDFETSSEVYMLRTPIPWHPNESDRSLADLPSGPDGQHWLGTDDRGRDVAARLIYGLRNSLIFAISVWLISFVVGTILGALQGFVGGKVDFLLQRLIEVLSSIPSLFLLIILVSILQPSIWLLVVFSSFLSWIGISYYMRGEFLKLRKFDFVEAARAQGLSQTRIIFRHILPNALNPLITFSPFALTGHITGLASLDFLGFGLQPPAASWGELLSQALKHFDHAWWLAVFPSLALIVTLLLLNFVGEAFRDAFDPRAGA